MHWKASLTPNGNQSGAGLTPVLAMWHSGWVVGFTPVFQLTHDNIEAFGTSGQFTITHSATRTDGLDWVESGTDEGVGLFTDIAVGL